MQYWDTTKQWKKSDKFTLKAQIFKNLRKDCSQKKEEDKTVTKHDDYVFLELQQKWSGYKAKYNFSLIAA